MNYVVRESRINGKQFLIKANTPQQALNEWNEHFNTNYILTDINYKMLPLDHLWIFAKTYNKSRSYYAIRYKTR